MNGRCAIGGRGARASLRFGNRTRGRGRSRRHHTRSAWRREPGEGPPAAVVLESLAMFDFGPSTWLAIASGIGIAAASGLRAFLPLLAIGLAARFGLIELHPGTVWLASNSTLIALSVATVLEILGDKVPAVDHALDLVATVVRPLAAWLGAYAVMPGLPAPWAALISLALGGGALAFHLLKAKIRLGSTVTTLGAGNPVLSVIEDVTAVAILLVTVIAPFVVLLLVVLLGWWLVRGRRRRPLPAETP